MLYIADVSDTILLQHSRNSKIFTTRTFFLMKLLQQKLTREYFRRANTKTSSIGCDEIKVQISSIRYRQNPNIISNNNLNK